MPAAQRGNRDIPSSSFPKPSVRVRIATGAPSWAQAARKRAKGYLAGAALLLLAVMPSPAQEQPLEPYNVVITDQAAGQLASYSQLRIYSVDPIENYRLAEKPVAQFPSDERPAPRDPLRLQLDPGRYEMTVRVLWLPVEVHYTYFTVVDSKTNVIDLLTIELPEELMTY
jgi:hypothetical protein